MDAAEAERFETFVDLLRARIGAADREDVSAIHDLCPLMADITNVPPDWMELAMVAGIDVALPSERTLPCYRP